MRSRKDVFISCPKNGIIIEEVKLEKRVYYLPKWSKIDCPAYVYPSVKGLLKCNGLFDVCDSNDVDILTALRRYANNCNKNQRYNETRVCIVFDCIHGTC